MPKLVKPKLSALQKGWLHGRYNEGRRVAVIVGSPEGSLTFENGEWERKKSSTNNVLTKPELISWLVNKIGTKSDVHKTV